MRYVSAWRRSLGGLLPRRRYASRSVSVELAALMLLVAVLIIEAMIWSSL